MSSTTLLRLRSIQLLIRAGNASNKWCALAAFSVIPRRLSTKNAQPLTSSGSGDQKVILPYRVIFSLSHVPRPATASTMAQLVETTCTSKAEEDVAAVESNLSILKETAAVIRYQPNDERFQMQITLYNGKTFNFDRKCSDSVSAVVTRMVVNISKKVKKFNGTVKVISAEDIDENEEIGRVLTNVIESSTNLKLQVGEDVYDVVFNPPEVHTAKFLSTCLATLPLFPYRMETSSNFSKEQSIYEWRFSLEKPKPVPPAKLRKKCQDEFTTDTHKYDESWVKCGSSLVLTPTSDMVGGYLQFRCIPSNGKVFGKPFILSLPNQVQPVPVDKFLFQERLSRLNPKPEGDDCFRVLSYNVLADTYATPEWFFSSPKESLDAGYRLPVLNQEIQSYQADIICLQEVDDKYFEGNYQPYLETLGFKGFHISKVGSTKEGIATFYNPNKLSLIKSYECVILDHMKTLPFWEKLTSAGEEFTIRLEERNTVFQLSVFCLNNGVSKTMMLVGNVHLYFHPDADHIRLLQTATCINFLESKISQLRKQISDCNIAVMYCGDMNCTPPFSSYRLLTTGNIEESDEDWTSHPTEKLIPGITINHDLNFANSHPGVELTNITTCFEGCLDYILYQAEQFELLGICPVPSKEELATLMKFDELRKVSLPNFYTPSDHLPIIADFKIKY